MSDSITHAAVHLSPATAQREARASYDSGLTIHEEALVDGRWIGRSRSRAGSPSRTRAARRRPSGRCGSGAASSAASTTGARTLGRTPRAYRLRFGGVDIGRRYRVRYDSSGNVGHATTPKGWLASSAPISDAGRTALDPSDRGRSGASGYAAPPLRTGQAACRIRVSSQTFAVERTDRCQLR
jgi:hypothetical protein